MLGSMKMSSFLTNTSLKGWLLTKDSGTMNKSKVHSPLWAVILDKPSHYKTTNKKSLSGKEKAFISILMGRLTWETGIMAKCMVMASFTTVIKRSVTKENSKKDCFTGTAPNILRIRLKNGKIKLMLST